MAPRAARFRVPVQPGLAAQFVEPSVAVLHETVGDGQRIVAEEPRGGVFVGDVDACQGRQVRVNVVAAELEEVLFEAGRPAGRFPFPAHVVEVGQGIADQRPGVGDDGAAHAVEMRLDGLDVQDVDVLGPIFHHDAGQSQDDPATGGSVPLELAVGVDLVASGRSPRLPFRHSPAAYP